MKEEHSSGGRQFMIVLLWSVFLYIACGALMSVFGGEYAWIGGIISLIVFCVFGYFVLVHYTARFTYSLKNGSLRINRMIGKRNKEVEFLCKDITRTTFGAKPSDYAKPMTCMRINVINKKQSMYIEFKTKNDALASVVIEPSDKLRRRIEKERKKTDG